MHTRNKDKTKIWLKNSKISDLILGAGQVFHNFMRRCMKTTVIYNSLGSILILKVKAPNAKSETNDLLCLSEHFEE